MSVIDLDRNVGELLIDLESAVHNQADSRRRYDRLQLEIGKTRLREIAKLAMFFDLREAGRHLKTNTALVDSLQARLEPLILGNDGRYHVNEVQYHRHNEGESLPLTVLTLTAETPESGHVSFNIIARNLRYVLLRVPGGSILRTFGTDDPFLMLDSKTPVFVCQQDDCRDITQCFTKPVYPDNPQHPAYIS